MIRRGRFFTNRHEFPFPFHDTVGVIIDRDIEPSDLVSAYPGLSNQDIILTCWFLKDSVGVTANDQINTPCRIQHPGEFPVRVKPDMGKKHRQVDVVVLVGIADPADLRPCLLEGNETPDLAIPGDRVHHFVSDNTNKEDVKTSFFEDDMGHHQALVIFFNVQVCVDNREIGHSFEEEKMFKPVIQLMITECGHIGRKIVHDLDSRNALVFRIDKGSLYHVPCDHIQDVFLFSTNLVEISRKQGKPSYQLSRLTGDFGKEIPVHVI